MKGKKMDVGLARVSTLDQNPALQITALEQAGCGAIYQEQVSGIAAKRPVRDQVLAELQAGDTLTVWKLDRLGRSTAELLSIVRDLDQRQVRFRCLTQPVDTSTPGGRLFLGILALIAEFERELMIERVLAGKAQQRAQGRPMGRLPFGWQDQDTVNQDQAQLLIDAARQLLDGVNVSTVVDRWNAAGIAPERGTRWSVTPLRRMLVNPRTALIVGQDRHQALVRLFSQPDRQRQGRPAEHLLSGILACVCGQALYADVAKNQHVYRCRKAAHSGGRSAGCGRINISERAADEAVAEMFIAAVIGPDFAQSLNQRQREILDQDATAQDLDDWRAEITDLETVPARFAPPDATERLAQLRRLVREATARLMAQPDLARLLDLPRSEAMLRARWSTWTIAERRAWLRRVVDRIVVKKATSVGRGSDVAARLDPRWIL